MQTSSAGGYVDFSRFGAMRQEAATDQRAALEKVADEFEALFVDLMLKSARQAEIKGGLFDSQAMSTYREMFDHQIAMTLAQNNDLGIGKAMARQLEGLLDGEAESSASSPELSGELRRFHGAPHAPPPDALAAIEHSDPFHQTLSSSERSGGSDAREQFRSRLAPYAAEAGDALNLPARAILAQAALETGWGQHVIQRADGSSSHNYFGIKAGREWRGEVVKVPTTEYIDGRAVSINATFRAYATPLEAFHDYAEFLHDNPRYRGVLASGKNESQFAHGLAAAGYATDPRYAEKIIAIIETGDWGEPASSAAGAATP